MRVQSFGWLGAAKTAAAIREWGEEAVERVDVLETFREVRNQGDEAVLEMTAKFDATDRAPESLSLVVDPAEATDALASLDRDVRRALEAAAENIRTVAQAQAPSEPQTVRLPEGQSVTLREVPVGAAGIYAPAGRAAYPSSVLMCAIPAQVAGVERIALASPPGPDGRMHPLVLAAAALCGIEEIYAMGGAQAIFALALGTETVPRVDLIAGPGNTWVQEAKHISYGFVGIDSYAGPSELMVVAGHDTNPEWVALDLCAQAEHGADSPLVAVAVEAVVLDAVAAAVRRAADERPGVANASLALVQVPDLSDAIDLANAYAPEHLELLEEDAALLADRVTTAGCVFAGRHAATAFGDYVAGSNHVLPTTAAGRFAGPLGPGTFRRRISTVEIPAEAADALAPHVDALARAEGFPVHAESAMIRR